jgi:Calcineurin-like phosphoesterase/Purple acid Phosphatase, N-terminal domain
MTKRRDTMDRATAEKLSLAEQHDWFRQQRSRRAVLRGGLAGAGVLLAGPALLGGTAVADTPKGKPSGLTFLPGAPRVSGKSVAPFGRHLAFGADPSSQMTITWQVPAAVAQPFVRVGLRPGDLGAKIPAALVALNVPAIGSNPAITQYYLKAELDHLFPATTYWYGVGHQGYDPADSSVPPSIWSFQTAPGRGRPVEPFTFTAFGDQGSSYNAVANDSVILGQQPAFHLHAGDISYADSDGEGLVADAFDVRLWDSWFTQIEPVAAQVPWMVALGNHDMEAWLSPDGYGGDVARFHFPGNGPAVSPGTYSFVYGDVAVISLDANDVSNEIPANNGFTAGAQQAWLAAELASLRARRDIDFIVVFFHHCAYSTCSVHASEGGVRAEWTALFDQFSVDLVVNGHNHIYERTDPIRAGASTTSAPIGATVTPATQGTTYLTAGAAGRSLYSFGVPDSYQGHLNPVESIASFINEPGGTTQAETVDWSQVRFTGYSFIAADVTPARPGRTATIGVRVLTETGVELDQFTLARTAGPH